METPRPGPAKRSSLATFHVTEARQEIPVATDVDYIIGLGYNRDVVIAAMTTTRGDKAAALDILRRGGAAPSDSSWRSELKDDFTSGLHAVPLPNSVENRALWKSPLYVRVGEPRTRDGRTFYQTSVVRKDGLAWKLEKAYSDFHRLKNKLPLFSTNSFKNQFPAKNDVAALFGSVNTELRRRGLEEWMRELCLDEECMQNEEILRALNAFVEGDSQLTGAVAPHSPQPPTSTNSRYTPGNTQCSTGTGGKVSSPSPQPGALTSAAFVASLPEVKGPLTYHQLQSSLPFRIPVLSAQHRGDNEISVKDSSDAQLEKDFSRDRIIVQGRRLEGSSTTLPQIVQSMKDAVAQLLVQNNKQPLSGELSSSFFISLLKKMSRTESAFLCHSAFCQLLLEDEGGVASGSGSSGDSQHPTPFDHPNILVVPESGLAGPIKVNFHIKVREGTGEWCLQADCEAGTSYRVNDAESDDITTLLQVKVTWHKVMFAMPKFATERGVVGPVVCELSERDGKGVVVAERDTRSTSRDWRA